MLARRISNLASLSGVYRTHHPPYDALVRHIEATDRLIDLIRLPPVRLERRGDLGSGNRGQNASTAVSNASHSGLSIFNAVRKTANGSTMLVIRPNIFVLRNSATIERGYTRTFATAGGTCSGTVLIVVHL